MAHLKNPIAVERLYYDGDLLLAGGRVHEH